jgi:hypothetical protein
MTERDRSFVLRSLPVFASANLQGCDTPDVFAAFQPDGDCPDPQFINHHRAGFVNVRRHAARPDRADGRIAVKQPHFPGSPGSHPPGEGRPVLEHGEAALVQPPCQLVDGPRSRQDFNGSLDCGPGDGADLTRLLAGAGNNRKPRFGR